MDTSQSDEPESCGRGLAANASLPGTIGELMAAMARVLAVHQQALDLTDDAARTEHEAYLQLCTAMASAASQLQAIASQMTAYRTLPMGRHDEQAMAAPEARQVFARFVRFERELLTLLSQRLGDEEEMLRQMGG